MIGLAQPVESGAISGRPCREFRLGPTGSNKSSSPPNSSGGDTRNPRAGQVRVPPASASNKVIRIAQPVFLSTGGQSNVPAGESPAAQNKVIGVVCSGDVAVYRDDVKHAIERGLTQRPDAVWVCCEPKSDRMTHDVMISLGIEPVVLPMNDWWRVKGTAPDGTEVNHDGRRSARDLELLHLCDELIVFHKRTGSSPWRERKKWGEENCGLFKNLFVVELGPEMKRTRKTRKPEGA